MAIVIDAPSTLLYTTAAIAPAAAALFNFTSKLHVPREISATAPFSAGPGSALHAIPSPSKPATSTSFPMEAGACPDAEPATPRNDGPPATHTRDANTRSFADAPTASTEGEPAGDP